MLGFTSPPCALTTLPALTSKFPSHFLLPLELRGAVVPSPAPSLAQAGDREMEAVVFIVVLLFYSPF